MYFAVQMALSRAEIQQRYREKKKRTDANYKQRERERKRKAYTPVEELNSSQLKKKSAETLSEEKIPETKWTESGVEWTSHSSK